MIARIVAFASVLLVILAIPARAEDWPRLPNGDVVLTIKGVRLVLPGSGEKVLKSIFFSYYNARTMRNGEPNLQWAIDNPDDARARFEAAQAVRITFGTSYFEDETSPTKPNAADFRTLYASAWIFGKPDCARQMRMNASAPAFQQEIESGKVPVDDDGWAMKGFGQNPDGTYFSRLFMRKNPTLLVQGISCLPFKDCGANFCIAPSVSASIKFYEPAIPRMNWNRL